MLTGYEGTPMIKGYEPTWAMNQFDVLSNDQLFQSTFRAPLTDHKRAGICIGLSMAWIARVMANHSETPADREKAFKKSGMWPMMYTASGKAQDLADASFGKLAKKEFKSNDPITEQFGAALKLYKLKNVVGSDIFEQTGKTAELGKDLAEFLSATTSIKKYRLYSIKFKTANDIAGHCCASYVSSGKIFGWSRHLYFFDSNLGEYKVGMDESAKFLAAWLKEYAEIGFLQLMSFEVEKHV